MAWSQISSPDASVRSAQGARNTVSPTARRPVQQGLTLQEKLRKSYSFPKEKTRGIFDWACHYGKVLLPRSKRPQDAWRSGDPLFYPYHQILGHPIEDCYVFKDIAQGLIDRDELRMGDYVVAPSRPHPMGGCARGIYTISVQRQTPEDAAAPALTEAVYDNYLEDLGEASHPPAPASPPCPPAIALERREENAALAPGPGELEEAFDVLKVEEGEDQDFADMLPALPKIEDGSQATVDELIEVNLGTRDDPRPTFLSALMPPH